MRHDFWSRLAQVEVAIQALALTSASVAMIAWMLLW